MKTLLAALLLLANAAHAADWIMECPAQLSTSQMPAGELPAGWSGIARTASSVHEAKPGASTTEATPPVAISVFDGPPSEMADLVPDNPNARVVQWTFKKPRTRDIYRRLQLCGYPHRARAQSADGSHELCVVGNLARRDLQAAMK